MLKIATWNLDLTKTPSPRKEQALLDHIAKQEADVWVFTEAKDAVTDKLPFDHKHSSLEGRDEDKADGRHWVTISSPLSSNRKGMCDALSEVRRT